VTNCDKGNGSSGVKPVLQLWQNVTNIITTIPLNNSRWGRRVPMCAMTSEQNHLLLQSYDKYKLRLGPLRVLLCLKKWVIYDWVRKRSYTEYKLKLKLNFMCLLFTDDHHWLITRGTSCMCSVGRVRTPPNQSAPDHSNKMKAVSSRSRLGPQQSSTSRVSEVSRSRHPVLVLSCFALSLCWYIISPNSVESCGLCTTNKR
jgi:hypothetical protein